MKSSDKRKAYSREHYKRHREKHIAQARRRSDKHRAEMRRFLWLYKEAAGCAACPERDPVCLDFHHMDDDKEIDIANAAHRGWGFSRILAEIDKCVVLCANCHRKEHAIRV